MLCKYCKIDQPEENFEIANIVKGKEYRRCKCKTCKRQTQAERVRSTRLWIDDYKKDKTCISCGFSNWKALSFHHRDPKTKRGNVSEMTSLSIDTIQIEIDKCDVLCCNCHMILEHDGRN